MPTFPSYARRLSGLLALILLSPLPARADWPSSPTANLPVCTADGNQGPSGLVTDGSGGVIISWGDTRLGSAGSDIYVQRVLANGSVDPSWPVNGRALCTAVGDQFGPKMIPDGAGGAIVAWQDKRGGATSDIYAHHLLASGVPDPAWPANGLAVCPAAGNQFLGALISDGAGNALVTWRDFRDTTAQAIYAQHVLASGQGDPGWPANGRELLTQPNTFNRQISPPTVPDGHGGAIVGWEYYNGGATADIYAQRVRANGTLDPTWPAGGLPVCTAAIDQLNPKAVVDAAGGAIICWDDARGVALDIYAQRVRADGSVDPAWPADGRLVCGAGGNQQVPAPASDGNGGALIAWRDLRGGLASDVYVQHLLSNGSVDPGWPVDGRAVCTAINAQDVQLAANDGAGGVLLAWSDQRTVSSSIDIYAAHVLATGVVDPAWPVDGRAVSTAARIQSGLVGIADGSGGLIMTWGDQRSGGLTPNDVYAQRVQANGQLGGTVVGVPRERLFALTLDPVQPNPWHGEVLRLSFSLASDAVATLEVVDLMGRRVAAQELEASSQGRQSTTLRLGRYLAPGIYLVRLRQGEAVRTRKFAALE